MILSMMQRLKPTGIVSVPSFLRRIAGYAGQQGVDLRKSTWRKLICIGEPVRGADWRPTALGAQVEEAWGRRCTRRMGSRSWRVRCASAGRGEGGICNPELLYVEIVDDAGAGGDGESGHW